MPQTGDLAFQAVVKFYAAEMKEQLLVSIFTQAMRPWFGIRMLHGVSWGPSPDPTTCLCETGSWHPDDGIAKYEAIQHAYNLDRARDLLAELDVTPEELCGYDHY